jgi:tRNA-2-methylthio-N6-dimethylallyladenosine synthase
MGYKPRTYNILTYGCQANHADSSAIAGVLEAVGFEKSLDRLETDVLVINTCSVRQKSEDKVYGLGKGLKRAKKRPFVIMAGCMVGSVIGERQRYPFEELKGKTPWVDEYISPAQIYEIPQILEEHNLIGEWAADAVFPRVDNPEENNEVGYVSISFGCDNFCRFCVVPYARGKEVSRSEEEIIREVKHLIGRGFKHIMLCGQNVNSWGLSWDEKFAIRSGSDQKLPFANLLRKVHEIDGLEKLSFISSNPFDFTEDLIEAIQLSKIDNFLHIAVQSGNNDVLKRMNRRYTIEKFISLLNRIKEVKPKVEFGTDIIVGFPGETQEQFMDSVKLFKTIPFNVAFISMYSQRKGTPAEKLYKDDVSLKEKKRRHAYLTKVWKETKPK